MTEHKELRVAVILGSIRTERICTTVADWFVGQLQLHDQLAVDVCDLAEIELPPDLSGGGDADTFSKRIGAADAVVIITPEYNRGYPGALKTAIDTVVEEWKVKPVGMISYGGVSGGLRAVEQLRGVFGELHAITLRDTVSFPNVRGAFDQHGRLLDPEPAAARAGVLIQKLGWWARATRTALDREPYPA